MSLWLFLPHGPLGGRVASIASKSQLQRLLLCAALADRERTEMRYEAPVLSPNMPPIPLSTAPLEIPTRCGGVVLFVLDVAQSARY